MKPRKRPPTVEEVATDLLHLLLRSSDVHLAIDGLRIARRARCEPAPDRLGAWIERIESSDAIPLDSLLAADRSCEDLDLFDAIVRAAARERRALPLHENFASSEVWTSVPPPTLEVLLDAAFEESGAALHVEHGDFEAQDNLAVHLDEMMPALHEQPVDRIEWWVSRVTDTENRGIEDLDYGTGCMEAVGRWAVEVASQADPETLRRVRGLAASCSHAATARVLARSLPDASPS